MLARFLFVFACFIAFGAFVHAQPANVLVGDLTFVRPEKWVWQAPASKSSAMALFLIPDASGDTSTTNVRFHNGPKNPSQALEAWKKFFPNPKDVEDVLPEEKTINKRSLTYFWMTGTFAHGMKPTAGYAMLGAVMPSVDRFVHVLLIGPEPHVREAEAEFRKMVETALKEAE
jgi:hypothetical protein